EEFLRAQLRTSARARFGEKPLPAVRLQLQQLDRRLRTFARIQAGEARGGWRIAHAELKLEGAFLDVDGVAIEIKGRVDRIDRHADGRWRILDYKTGDDACDPKGAHLTRNGWRDLQLPLYRHFLRERLPGAIELGYFALTRKLDDCGVYLARLEEAELDGAIDEARRIVREMLAGDFARVLRGQPSDRVQRALCGLSLLALESAGAADHDDPAGEEAE
ncbi:MAG TPA: PD-(D/E)XK nuclease family protein, partial [Planctomycetota bacterium]|nr:PD-(D/E)XK nuclease family protein [Planctomycetota bacterium]